MGNNSSSTGSLSEKKTSTGSAKTCPEKHSLNDEIDRRRNSTPKDRFNQNTFSKIVKGNQFGDHDDEEMFGLSATRDEVPQKELQPTQHQQQATSGGSLSLLGPLQKQLEAKGWRAQANAESEAMVVTSKP
eukprot:c7357_g1_i1.p1 GENE.c7357_g1_i1~~c7357_g1_i1.p1  ORF type:complete len:131 (+),score=41.42 c7357_g1_i1:498-890(+)